MSILLGMTLRLTIMCSLMCAGLLIVLALFMSGQTEAIMWAAALTIPITLSLWRENTVRAYGNVMLALAPRHVIVPILMISVVMIFSVKDLTTTMAIYVLIMVATEFLALRKIRHEHNFSKKFAPKLLKKWLSISLPLGFTAMTNFAITRWDIIVVGALLGMDGAASYSVASRIALLVSIFLRLINIAISPTLASQYYRKQYRDYKQTILLTTIASAIVGIPIYLCMFIYSHHLLSLFGDEYVTAIRVLQILAFGQMCNVLTGPAGIALAMSGREKQNLVYSSIGCVLSLLGLILLVPRYGISGAAIATSSGIILINILQFRSCYRLVRLLNSERHSD